MKGFSLIEVLVALFITGAIVLVIANIPQVVKLITGSQSETKVREVAAKIIEDSRFSGYDNLSNGTAAISDSRLNALNNVSGSTIVADCPVEICTNGEQVKKITVTISWEENTEPKNVRVVTLVGKGGLK